MPFDPNIPGDTDPILAPPLRQQFNGLQTNIQAKAFEDDCVGRLMTTARNSTSVAMLDLTPSDPPTQAEMQAVVLKLNELIQALQR